MKLTDDANTIQLLAGNVAVGFHTDTVSYDLGITKPSGSLDAVINGLALAVNVEVGWELQTNGRYEPKLITHGSSVAIPDNGLEITLTGGALAEFVSILKPLFKSIIHDQVTK